MGKLRLFDTLGKQRTIIGMVHLGPMPGTPFYEEGSYAAVKERAVADGVALYQGGASGCLVQTIDQVYTTVDEADPARTAGVANIVQEIAGSTGPEFQIGVQILRNAIRASLAVAKVSGGSFVRCGALVGRTMTGDGLMDSNPMAVMSYRRQLNAMDIKLIAEIHSMHFKALDGTSPVELARNAVRVGADAVSLGDPDENVTIEMIGAVRQALPDTPIFLPGYTNHDNAARLLPTVDGAFVGTCLEKSGWASAIDEQRVRAYMDIVSSLS
jgi:membrane complex biogenesis BtpA family protein